MSFPKAITRFTLSALLLSNSLVRAEDGIIQTTATTATVSPDMLVATVKPTSEPEFTQPFISLMAAEGLEGWQVHEGKATAWKREGEIISCLAATGGWLRTQAAYSDFVLRLEYRLQAGGNTGIGLRAPGNGNPTFTGLEIQLLDDTSPKYADLRADQYTGSVYYQVAATRRARLNPLNEWNQCEIRCLGDELTVKINGEVVNQVQLNRPIPGQTQGNHMLSQRPPLGHIALQSHSSRVDFRKIELQDLTHRTASGLQITELAIGNGEVVGDAKSVTLHYVGQLATGKRFADSREMGAPIQTALSEVIPGLQEGLQGMKVNGRRRLIVPPHLAYGAQGVPATIPPDATLVFEVEVHGIVH